MNNNAKKWIAALRSGDYKQGLGALCQTYADGDCRYCCLGVACEVAIKSGVPIEVSGCTYRSSSLINFDGHLFNLPESVREWLGLNSVFGSTSDTTLTMLNDQERKSFSEIADFIEEHADELFFE